MSTTFDVYPGKEYIPSFAELLDISNKKVNDFLRNLGISKNITIDVEVHNNTGELQKKFNIHDKLIWNNESYAWFFIRGVNGGTDSYYYKITELDREIWKNEIETNIKARELRDIINKSINIGYYWSFRKSIGQPGIINLAYGLIAASLAEITGGFVYSDDGAWDYSYFPALPEDFFRWYFKPEYVVKNEDKVWLQNCIKSICKELN
ncbi:MAG TPA: hypothetical protein DEF39_00700 [Hungateiclostridium thermocellum]|jgi:hypothetical protein|uniref:Uncharacterized protein n=2 Tax=Acetivibrio thermocellus TaxID=1515 RepID=A3DIJ3_ACET2|nr:hypothetical protein [Acetivibrio thermocellus]CDG37035.1 hypothetical protein CTHBC1_2444 [Acetivibrio thermocellus BC1]ABN53772.1 hypothetical protein Cthe_2572 [Acetivibrio thermocellus ATCC 27405]ADU73254.1 hypothetical protein Clo1313_0159 [Acetivibrio thermocellus DSM 1313]ALX07172.1 hypothetical protein AD2_00161 [Acetivibrio thermocellus AD2]ANV74908.1 hypothetical protein LQRI_0160 [Acetivibrio thermocellus DSM 2360]